MATANNTLKMRIQLKSDTEANWDLAGPHNGSPGFIPLRGELIIYSADSDHQYSRLKVGDGQTDVTSLPFIDAGTLNGTDTFIVKYANRNAFPAQGQSDRLYIDLSTDKVYHYVRLLGYKLISNVTFTTTTVSKVVSWDQGLATSVGLNSNRTGLVCTNGYAPELLYTNTSVVNNITQ